MSEQLVTFNAYVGNRDPRGNLHALADDVGAPLAIAAQELKRYAGTFPGYDRIDAGAPRNSDAAGCVLFVRKRGVTIVKERIVEVDGPRWKGPKHGDWRDPRTFVGGTLEVEATGWRVDVLDMHRTAGGPKARMENAAQSWAAEDAAIEAWVCGRLARHPNRSIVLLADWNNSLAARGPLTVRDLARRLDAQPLIPRVRPAIDGALLINCHGRARKLRGGYGSDGHRPVVVTVRHQEKP